MYDKMYDIYDKMRFPLRMMTNQSQHGNQLVTVLASS